MTKTRRCMVLFLGVRVRMYVSVQVRAGFVDFGVNANLSAWLQFLWVSLRPCISNIKMFIRQILHPA